MRKSRSSRRRAAGAVPTRGRGKEVWCKAGAAQAGAGAEEGMGRVTGREQRRGVRCALHRAGWLELVVGGGCGRT